MARKTTQTMSVETEGDNSEVIKVAVINNEIKHLGEAMNRLEAKFDQAILGFVTHEKLSDVQKSFEAKHEEHGKAITSLEDWNKWAIRVVLFAVIVAVIGTVIVVKT